MSLAEDIREVLNRHCAESGSNTPDYILADYLFDCLQAYDNAVRCRAKWYGRMDKIGDRRQDQGEVVPHIIG